MLAMTARPNTPPAMPNAKPSFWPSVVGSESMGRLLGVAVLTSAQTVYAEVGDAGPGDTVG